MKSSITAKVLESENLVCSVTAGTKTSPGMIQVSLNYFTAYFFKALSIRFSREAKERYAPVVVALLSFSLFVYEDDHPAVNQSCGALPEQPAT